MSLCTNVVRRNGIYRFRVRVPADLRKKVGRAEISRSLGTRSKSTARSLASPLYRKTEQLWSRMRLAMTREEIDRLVDEWIEEKLVNDAAARADLSFAEAFARPGERLNETATAVWQQEALQGLERWQEAAEQYDWARARPLANLLIKAKNLPIEKDSEPYRLLCMGLTFASARVEGIRLERSEGVWSERPRFSLADAAPSRSELPAASSEAPAAPSAPGELLSVLVPRFLDEQKLHGGYQPKRLMDFEAALRLFARWLGKDPAVGEITKKDLGDFRQFLPKLPPNATKRFSKLSLQEIVDHAKANGLPTLQPQTINTKYLTILGHFFEWCVSCGLVDANPAEGIRVKKSKAGSEKRRHPFKTEHLQALFRAPLYAGCRSESHIYEPGEHHVRDHRYWLPLLGLFTGARLGELCQLRVEDVRQIDGIWCLDITEEGGGRLKTKAARRVVPVHAELDRLGFLAHVERARKAGRVRLFPEIEPGKGGYLSDHPSKWFARFLRLTLGEKTKVDAGLTFHSFRHTMKDALRAAGVDERVQDALLGHENNHVSSQYGDGYKAPRLHAEISKVRYVGIDLSSLRISPFGG